jgi:hypothetical protein
VRKPSKLSQEKRKNRVEAARRMTGEQKLEACARLSLTVYELHQAGKQFRADQTRRASQ